MTFIELAKQRYSCRNYKPGPVEQEKLELILEAGRVAPSAVNFQPWYFIVIREKDHCDIDIAIAVDHMTLQATELGLATCWVCNFNTEKTVNTLDLPYRTLNRLVKESNLLLQ